MSSFWTLQRSLMIVAFVAVLSTLLLVGVQRRRELGLLAAIGMQPGELSRMVLAEGATVGLVGTALGSLAGIGMFEALRQTMTIAIGWHDPFRLHLTSVPLYGALVTIIVVAAAAGPAWRTARLDVVEALQYE